jgi:hypothetical protein
MSYIQGINHNAEKSVDQRVASRYSIQVPVELLFENGGRLRVLTRNVSASGIFVMANKSLQLCDRQHFLITFPREITTSCNLLALCDGAVVRREPREELEGVAIKIERYQFLSLHWLSLNWIK